MRKLAAGCMPVFLTLTVFLTLPLQAEAGRLTQSADASSESYSLKTALYADDGHGKQDPLGDLRVCVVVTTGARAVRVISLSVSMPDSGQILTIEAPIKQQANGDMVFQFEDDGWGNAGRGTLKEVGNKAQLEIEKTRSSANANKNIGRNYGSYILFRGACR